MGQVTLIGDKLAREGESFVFLGPGPACGDCRLQGPCLNLEPGHRYRVSKVRDVHHPDGCAYHEGGVRAVEVEPVSTDTSLPSRLAVEGSRVAYKRPVCSNHACAHFARCHPLGLPDATKVRIRSLGSKLRCPIGYDLVAARVEPV